MTKDTAKQIKLLMKEAGQEVEITSGGETYLAYAFLQPLRYKNKMYIELQPSEVGRVDDGCYLYLGPADTEFSADDILYANGRRFVAQRVEKVYLFSKPLYCWATLRPCVDSTVN